MGSGTSTKESSLPHFIGGEWRHSQAGQSLPVVNPATQEVLARTPLGGADDVQAAVAAAARAFPEWRRTPPEDRIQYLFRMKQILDENFEAIARVITQENGKTLAESRGELRRAVENVEVACGIPMMMQGHLLEDVAPGIDEFMVRQPLGVTAAISPFNFPAMIPFWFLPYAIACGNSFILKPSERVPLTSQYIFELFETLGLPPGVLNLLHGGKETVNALLDHPGVRAISFVGSTPVARHVYARAAASGKRVQAQGGAKNHVLILPDADMEMTAKIVSDSAFGCAGQRCLAVSVAVTVAEAQTEFGKRITETAASVRVGNGLEDGVEMGPVITPESKRRILDSIGRAPVDGATIALDGRDVGSLGAGNFVRPTVLDNVPAASALSDTELFGPVLSVVHAHSLEEGLRLISQSSFGNAASIFTSSGAAARKFRYQAEAGNIGVNIGVAAPVACFPFSGWKDSFFGVVHAQGRDAIEFYTDKKVVIERWPKEWSRRF